MANKTKAKEFVEKWKNKGDEKQDTSRFWIELLQEVYGDSEVHNDTHLSFEVPTGKNNKKGKEFKDVVINRRSNNNTLIEQKSFDVDLDHKAKQSDGSLLTPFEQALKYDNNSSVDDKARWIITCNFQEFRIYDMKKEGVERYNHRTIMLDDLLSKIEWLDILLPNYTEDNPQFTEEVDVSVKAGELVGKMYDALLIRYAEPNSEHTQKELNKLCVRLVFCLYADDAGLFDKNDTNKFENYIKSNDTKHVRQALIDLFKVLDQKDNERDKYLDESLKSFPYVNGGLFQGEVEIPNFDDELKKLLVEDEAAAFDWSVVSPTIFGAVFESTLNAETRRSGGMHYTSIENIHKVIDPLFLDGLKKELNDALSYSVVTKKEKALLGFQNKISNLTFMDPACGSGNFLTETYLSLRRLENEVIRQLQGIKVALDFENNSVIKVSIQQLYGIEINDFAVSVAKTALWIAESQMFHETETILSGNREYFPLQSFNNIVEGNALRIDWNNVIDKSKLDYIMGNPPFVANGGRVANDEGSSSGMMSKEQKEDRINLFGKKSNTLDYVACWFMKSANYIIDSQIHCAFVSTNSITQGQQVSQLWEPLFGKGININFAVRTFGWKSEASDQATVFVVIVGFSYDKNTKKYIYSDNSLVEVQNINGYLNEGDNVFVGSRTKPLQESTPIMKKGSSPLDGGYLSKYSVDEKNKIVSKYPSANAFFKLVVGGDEYISNKERYCIWLDRIDPSAYAKIKPITDAISEVRNFRTKSKRSATVQSAKIPYLFGEMRQPKCDYLAIPEISSGNREYIPIGFLNKEIIATSKLQTIENASIYHFGVLTSKVHMLWMKTVCGYYGPSYDYSANIVYNNYPWPMPSEEQKLNIEHSAQAILDARALYPNSSLADLYDPLKMPIELRKAHNKNDKAVMEAYGYSRNLSEQEIVTKLFEEYSTLVAND